MDTLEVIIRKEIYRKIGRMGIIPETWEDVEKLSEKSIKNILDNYNEVISENIGDEK